MTAPVQPAPAAAAAPFVAHVPPPRRGTGPVLLATDGRDAAAGAVRAAAAAARRLGGRVEVLAVVEPFATYGADLLVALPPELETDRRADADAATRRQLAATLPADTAAGWRVDAVTGSPTRRIVETARARAARLVVLGLGKHAPVDRVFGSETALGVLRQADCPVLAVPEDAGDAPRHAVAAVDFSAASVRAAEVAADLLADGGTLTLVHVRPSASATLSGGVALLSAWEAAYARRTEELFGRLTALLHARRPGLTVTSAVRTGDPATAVLAAAGLAGADLIATGTQGANAVERLLLGSVATAVIRRAAVAVLACREPGAAEAARLERALFGATEQTDHVAWAALLDEVTARNAGRRTRVEVEDRAHGADVAERGYRFLGAAYDRHDRRVALMFGEPGDRATHHTRSLAGVELVQVVAGTGERDAALRVQHAGGHTTVTFEDGPR